MTSEALEARRQIEHLLEIHREMSRSRPVEETVCEFLRLVKANSPATWLVYVLCWPRDCDEASACRVIYDGAIHEGSKGAPALLSMFAEDAERFPLVEGGLLSELMAKGAPRIVNDLRIDPDDPGVGHLSGRARSLMGVPIYWEGRITNWSFSFAPEPGAFSDSHVQLALSNGNMVVRSVVQLSMRERVEELNERLEHQLEELGRVQRSMLPQSAPEIDGWRLATSYRPSLHAGGDYYDFTTFPDGRQGIVIADVSGHGAGAAAVMAVMRTILHTLDVTGIDSRHVIGSVNRIVIDSIGRGMFVSAFFAALDVESGDLACVNCGHPPPRLFRGATGEVEPLDGEGLPPLGLAEYAHVPWFECRLAPGDAVVFYTDGITELFDAERRMFGLAGLDRAAARGGPNAIDIIAEIERDVRAHSEHSTDDQTLVVLERRGT